MDFPLDPLHYERRLRSILEGAPKPTIEAAVELLYTAVDASLETIKQPPHPFIDPFSLNTRAERLAAIEFNQRSALYNESAENTNSLIEVMKWKQESSRPNTSTGHVSTV